MRISFLLPCFDEQDNIRYIEDELFPIVSSYDHEVIFVDDGSSDRTGELLEELRGRHPRVTVLRHERNRGLGAAIRTGLEHATGELAVVLDSDLTFHPAQIPDLLERFREGDADCVVGSPALQGYDRAIPRYRVLLSRSVNRIYRVVLGEDITGVSTIFRLYKVPQIRELALRSDGFEINAEIVAKLLLARRTVVEVPARLTQRRFGESKLNNVREARNHLRLIGRILYWRLVSAVS
jgi:dolichol-phosphate mannosyltransferase